MAVKCLLLLIVIVLKRVNSHLVWETPNDALDNALYEAVLDPELCDEQVKYVASDSILRLRFLDSGIRTPRGILEGNTLDLGNYHQCLRIQENLDNSELQGKYCMIRVPLSQDFENFSELPEWVEFNPKSLVMRNETIEMLENWQVLKSGLRAMGGMPLERLLPESPLSTMTFRLAVCIPKPCSTEQAITSLLFNVTELGFRYEDDFCRLPNDKPWAPADTAAVVVFSVLGIVTLISTCYDLHHTIFLGKDPKTASTLGSAFSLYTNLKRLTTFSSAGSLACVDGARVLAMWWVINGHAFTSESHWLNPFDTYQWTSSFEALWITGAHITVDTFFTLSGLLVVYTTANKFSGMQLLKNIHLFYLNRLLRMFPLLAAGVLLEASLFNHLADGPDWSTIVSQVDRCRTFWWSTLLHIQNYLNPAVTCIGQSWYLAIDTQLHILSPLILFWVLNGRTSAWIGLSIGLLSILAAATTFNFIMDLPSSLLSPNRGDQFVYYLHNYYVNTLTRASPFVVGMIFGYLLHIWRDEKIKITKIQTLILWLGIFIIFGGVMYSSYPILQLDWDNQVMDNLLNSFIRPIWAVGIGGMIFLCAQGYGGPINGFLSLNIWRLPARISYAMYIYHWVIMTTINSTAVMPLFFVPGLVIFKALAHYVVVFMAAFLLTLVVDAPFSTLFKLLLGKGTQTKKKPASNSTQKETTVNEEK